MTDTKHTLGPWKRGKYGGVYPVNGDKYGGPGIVSALTKSGVLPNAKANETLAAAAPELLDCAMLGRSMCMAMIVHANQIGKPLQDDHYAVRDMPKFEAAISKAKGKQND